MTYPTEKELYDFVKSKDFIKILGKKVSLWNNPPLPIFKIVEVLKYNGSHFECNSNKGLVVIPDITLYQLLKFGKATNAFGCLSEIIE